MGGMAFFHADKIHILGGRSAVRVCGLKVSHSHVHILADGNVKGVAGLVCVHDVGLVVKNNGVFLYVVERKVNIVGIVGENAAQMLFEGCCSGREFNLGRELGLQFRGHVGNQAKLVVQMVIGFAIAHILVNKAAAACKCNQYRYGYMS